MVCAGVRILWLLLLAASPAQVNASGRLIIRFISYRNDDGEGSNGQCCDGRSIFCESQGGCDHYFIICADSHFGAKSACSYGSVQTGVTPDRKDITFGDNIGGTSNPMVFAFNKWTGGVKIHIDVYDDDSNNDDYVDGISTIHRGLPGQFETLLIAAARTSLSLGVQVICDLNYYGDDCTHYCHGHDSDAEGHYTCADQTGAMLCIPGWTGPDCKTNIDDCLSAPCMYNTPCIDRVNGYECNCPRGLYGKRCNINPNDCSSNPCINGASCLDGRGEYHCSCSPGYTGINCETDINECESKPCLNGGVCYDITGGFYCSCPNGFTGISCEIDTDECDLEPCLNGATCIDGVNNYTCICPPGYQGSTCALDVDECIRHPCGSYGSCINTPGSFSCVCKAGFTGQYCDQDVNECGSHPCQNGASCINDVASFTCQCANGYIGILCQFSTTCKSNPCQNGGVCNVLTNGDTMCRCELPYAGEFCQMNIQSAIGDIVKDREANSPDATSLFITTQATTPRVITPTKPIRDPTTITNPTTTITELTTTVTEPTTTITNPTTTITKLTTTVTEPTTTVTELTTTVTEPTTTVTELTTTVTESTTTVTEPTTTVTELTTTVTEPTTIVTEPTTTVIESTTTVAYPTTIFMDSTNVPDPTTTVIDKTTIVTDPTTIVTESTLNIAITTGADPTTTVIDPTTIVTDPVTTVLQSTSSVVDSTAVIDLTTFDEVTTAFIDPETTVTDPATFNEITRIVTDQTTNILKPTTIITDSTSTIAIPIIAYTRQTEQGGAKDSGITSTARQTSLSSKPEPTPNDETSESFGDRTSMRPSSHDNDEFGDFPGGFGPINVPDMFSLTLMFGKLLYDDDIPQTVKKTHSIWLEIIPFGAVNDLTAIFDTCTDDDGRLVSVMQLTTAMSSDNFLSPPLLVLSDRLRVDLDSKYGGIYVLPEKHDCSLHFKGKSVQEKLPGEEENKGILSYFWVILTAALGAVVLLIIIAIIVKGKYTRRETYFVSPKEHDPVYTRRPSLSLSTPSRRLSRRMSSIDYAPTKIAMPSTFRPDDEVFV